MNKIPDEGRCAICRGLYTHWGNNPQPLGRYQDRVCDECNMMYVLPARLRFYANKKENEKVKNHDNT